jgi:hypothetical protein
MDDFREQLDDRVLSRLGRAVEPLAASTRRKKLIVEELQSHFMELYAQELERCGDHRLAGSASETRFGDPEELLPQLQNCVPFLERLFFSLFPRKETRMSRWLWIIALIAICILVRLLFPVETVFVMMGAVVVLVAIAIALVAQDDKLVSRFSGRRTLLLVGCVGVLFGPSIILPAMARYSRDGVHGSQTIVPMIIGALIVVEGLCFIGMGMRSRHTPAL